MAVTYTKKDVDELIRTLRGHNGTPGVLERLAVIETTIKSIDQWVTAQKNKPDTSADGLVSWSWVRDKLVQPSFMLFIGWLLFSFIPDTLQK